MADPHSDHDDKKPSQVSTLDVVISVFRAWFGVQTEKNRQRDFSSNDPTPFIIAGIIFTLVMIVGVIIAVKMALSGT
jgi:hypothetical protein